MSDVTSSPPKTNAPPMGYSHDTAAVGNGTQEQDVGPQTHKQQRMSQTQPESHKQKMAPINSTGVPSHLAATVRPIKRDVSLSERRFDVDTLPPDMRRVYGHLEEKFGEE